MRFGFGRAMHSARDARGVDRIERLVRVRLRDRDRAWV